MLDKLFLQLLNMSFTGGIVILFVLAVRLLLKKAPKIYSYVLWSVVLFRLICPFSFESALSLLPTKANPIAQDIVYMMQPQVDTGIFAIDNAVNGSLPPASPATSINPLQIWLFIGSLVWRAGMAVLLLYSFIALLRLKRRLQGAVYFRGNIYLSDNIETAFVIGIFRPKIYLPANLKEKEQEYILLHEQTHIRRFDHIIKIISFLALCIHWFNPLVWLAFLLSARDMEMACDEAVIKKLGYEVKKDYSSSLLTLATGRAIVGGTPLAFGEGDTKSRVKNVLSYKKPAVWLAVAAILVVAVVVAGLMANPREAVAPGYENRAELGASAGIEGLWGSRTQYIGDNSAVWRVIRELSFPDNLQYREFALYTSKPPYGLEIKFKTEAEGGNYHSGILPEIFKEWPFNRNAILIFSLIENVDHITFTLDDGQNPYTLDYTRDWAEDFLGGGSLFARSETKEGFVELHGEIMKRITDEMEEQTKHYPLDTRQMNLTFFVKPDEPAEVIGRTAAEVWLKSLMDAETPAEQRIAAYEITDVSVIAGEPRAGEQWADMKYQYVVRVNYNITTATEDYFAPGDGVSGKGTFQGLFRELSLKAQEAGGFEIVYIGTGGGEQIFAPPSYRVSLTEAELKKTEELARYYFTEEAPYYEGVISIYPASDDDDLYRNQGVEGEYPAGDIIIYKVLTVKDEKDGNPERSISIARKGQDADWEVINQGY